MSKESLADNCNHHWRYRGVAYQNNGRQLPGSGATTINYYDVYFCEDCLLVSASLLNDSHDSYQEIRYGASPLPHNAEVTS